MCFGHTYHRTSFFMLLSDYPVLLLGKYLLYYLLRQRELWRLQQVILLCLEMVRFEHTGLFSNFFGLRGTFSNFYGLGGTFP